MFIKKNYDLWVDVNVAKLNFTKKEFGQKLIEYLGPTLYIKFIYKKMCSVTPGIKKI